MPEEQQLELTTSLHTHMHTHVCVHTCMCTCTCAQLLLPLVQMIDSAFPDRAVTEMLMFPVTFRVVQPSVIVDTSGRVQFLYTLTWQLLASTESCSLRDCGCPRHEVTHCSSPCSLKCAVLRSRLGKCSH